jgi:hypothetical protein
VDRTQFEKKKNEKKKMLSLSLFSLSSLASMLGNTAALASNDAVL